MPNQDKQHSDEQGIREGQQDRAQDDTAKQRQGLEDEKLRQAHERGPSSGEHTS
ncbi:hypothetical protein [Xanthomonas translucens]|uniref:hypothetical protein n=1 Tax=Xanthomonas campestris pv. translucens TaxID=343 RepID=UPI0003481AE0|nr:hypothetical protein [Xanthomonas translucens]MBC3973272.1 hypothetical protein [Xanthomonas translucens pv. undulosa]MCT8269736.1 hypothetical protein [Xanthomonas translucens pv. undulosa]MCT8280714.1 hypothetical protein [Xanthomonas translucens pv. undulosa]MCT8315679.1 hypothetical protein [Xanthomonas translucens pv. undulosa]QSQ40893.1 hypothetical protein ISN33_14910 [Xanthomonas translucens pv. translucens]